MAGFSKGFTQEKLASIADGLVVALAVSLPWSTSATSILAVFWLLALIPTLRWADIRREVSALAGGLPVLLVVLGVVGMLWADVTLLERWKGLDSFLKLLAIPLLLAQFRRSGNSEWVFMGYLVSCVALLAATAIVMVTPLASTLIHELDGNVLVKNAPTQAGEFVTCIFGLMFLAHEAAERRRWVWLFGCTAIISAMVADIDLLIDKSHDLGCCSDFARTICNQKIESQGYRCGIYQRNRDRSHCLDYVALLAWTDRGNSD